MKVKISRVNYPELWNSEFPVVALQTIGIAGKHNMVGMHLGKSFGELSEFGRQLEDMKISVRKNAKLEQAGLLDSERDALISGFRKSVRAFEYINLPEIKPYYETLNTLLEKHKSRTIAAKGRASETERIVMLEKDMTSNPDVQAALDALKLQPIVRRLFEANKEYDTMFREYIAEKSTEERLDIVALRRECSKAMGQFFDAVQYCAFAHEDIDYSTLINELNQLNNYYRTQLKARITRRKSNKKDKSESIPPTA